MKNVFAKKLNKLSDFEGAKPLPGEVIIEIDPAVIDYLPQQRKPNNPGFSKESLTELGQNMKRDGQQQAAVVRPNPQAPGRYLMVAGERRGRAAKLEGLTLKVVVREMTDEEHVRIQRAENIQREALTNEEIALALQEDKARLGTLEAVAKEWQKSVNWVSERLKYLEALNSGGAAVQAVQEGVTADVTTLTDLAKLERQDAAAAQAVIQQAKAEPGLNVRTAVRARLKQAKDKPTPAAKAPAGDTPLAPTQAPAQPSRQPASGSLKKFLATADGEVMLECHRSVWSIVGGPQGEQSSLVDTLVNKIWRIDPEVKIKLSPSN